MKKSLWIFIFFILIIGVLVFALNKTNNENESYSVEKMSAEDKVEEQNDNTINQLEPKEKNIEQELAEFSTKLPNDTKARKDNIKLACKTLNGTKIKSGEVFSFWDTLGCPTKEKGYQKAKTFTSDGEVTQSYGGGLCQISTTLYNAVLEVKELEVKERHEHSRDVTYIKDGKDAAVSFDTADFKFKNIMNYDIKIEARVEDNKVKIRLVRI